jgi:hypothetical protein
VEEVPHDQITRKQDEAVITQSAGATLKFLWHFMDASANPERG